MSHVARLSSAASVQTPPSASATRTAAPIGVAANQSSLRAAAEPESSSCFSQIGSMISSLVSSIFDWISSFWNYVAVRCTAADAAAESHPTVPTQPPANVLTDGYTASDTVAESRPTAPAQPPVNVLTDGYTASDTAAGLQPTVPGQPPANVLIAKARNFFETNVFYDTHWTDQSKVAFLMILNGQIVGASVATLQENLGTGSPNPFIALCNQQMGRIQQILFQHALNADSTVQIRIRILNPPGTFTDPSGDQPMTAKAIFCYDVNFSSSTDLRYSIGYPARCSCAPVTVAQDLFRGIRCDSPDQEALKANVLSFFTNPSDTQAGWIYSI